MRFDMKVTTIKETQIKKKKQNMSFKANIKDGDEQVEEDTDVNLIEYITLLIERLDKVVRRLDMRSKNDVTLKLKNKLPSNTKSFYPWYKSKKGYNLNKGKGVKCHECEGFGHIPEECFNFLRKQKKGYSITLLDEESKYDSESEKGQQRALVPSYLV